MVMVVMNLTIVTLLMVNRSNKNDHGNVTNGNVSKESDHVNDSNGNGSNESEHGNFINGK
jgi:hypothetical protein